MEGRMSTSLLGVTLCWLALFGLTYGLCPEGEPVKQLNIEDGNDNSVFDDLTMTEMKNLEEYLLKQEEFDLVRMQEAEVDSSYIASMEGYELNKSDVLKHLDKKQAAPERYAKVVLYRGSKRGPGGPDPCIEEYKVGPLPDPKNHILIQLETWKSKIPWSARNPVILPEYKAINKYFDQEMGKVESILREYADGYTYTNCTDKCLKWYPGWPGEYRPGSRSRKMWVYWTRGVEGWYANPIGLQMRVDQPGDFSHISSWNVDFVWFRGEHFDSMEKFKSKYAKAKPTNPPPSTTAKPTPATTERTRFRRAATEDRDLPTSLHFRGDPLPQEAMKGPRQFYPDGRRYKINGHNVDWQGWQFHFNMRATLGVQLHDIQFMKERIAYEISVQELSVRYSGGAPLHAHAAYHDSFLRLGHLSTELHPGLDCPRHATFFNFNQYYNGEPRVWKNVVCVFEWDRGIPLRRHHEFDGEGGYYYVQGMADNVLIVRSILTVFNYEYINDFMFHQNGVIESKISLSGYILTYYNNNEDGFSKYGWKVFDDTVGTIHHHAANLKVDLDIQGTKNRFETLDIRAQDAPPSDYGMPNTGPNLKLHQMERNLRNTERDALYRFNFDTPKYLLVSNEHKKNKFGNPRSYRIIPADISKWLSEGWRLDDSFDWAKYQVSVTKRKDGEATSNNPYNYMSMMNPVMKFKDYYTDDESIVDEDLVAWVTLGTFHIPHSEDIPIVTTPGVQLTCYLVPYNYFDEDPSLASRDNIRITPGEDGEGIYEYAGVDPEVNCMPRSGSQSGHVTSMALLIVSSLFLWLMH